MRTYSVYRTCTALTAFVVVLALMPSVAFAQEATVKAPAPIFLLPDATRVPLRTAAAGTRLRVLEENADWVKVEFHDPQFGPRVGYIEARHVTIRRPELEPMDLSVKPEPARVPAQVESAPVRQVPQQEVRQARSFKRAWIDVNLGFAAAAESRYESIFEGELYRETATFSARYRSPAGAEFDFGGGVMLSPRMGIGISFAGTAHEDNAELRVRIPHPTFFNTHASDTAPTEEKILRSEGSVNIQAMLVGQLSERLGARVFGGPSYFRLRLDAVSDIIYVHDFLLFQPVHEVEIRSYETTRIDFDDGGGWGFHVGGDLSFFFNRTVGVGWFAKYSRGTVKAFDPLPGATREFTTGGFQSGGGLRLRF
jgi:hypothetical protein